MVEKVDASALEREHTADSTAIDDYKNSESHIEEVAIARLTEDDLFKLSQESLNLKSWTGFRLFLILVVQGCNQAGYGVDWAVISGINSYKSFHSYFDITNDGIEYATMGALMSVGTIVGAPFQTFADKLGRRGINFLGNAIVIFSAIIQGCATNINMLYAGRFFLGFGSAIMSSPQYMAEVSPAHLRGRMVGIFGACFQVGSLAMLGGMVGFATTEDSNWSWRVPLLLEMLFPIIVCSTIYFITPESPRFYIMKGQQSKAKKMIAKYHTTSGDEDSPLVNAVVRQIEESLENDRIINRHWWNFLPFLTKKGRYRFLVLVLYACFQSWNGGGIISAYLSPALETIGITDQLPQLGINMGLTAVYFVFTAFGAYIVDKVHRRTLIFSGLISFVILQTAATITSWQYSLNPTTTTAALTLTWMFSYQVCSATLIATMHNLYPVEVLSLVLRAKGLGLFSLLQGLCGVIQQYGISLGISALGYKIWAVYVGYNFLQLIASYFVFPETYGLSLEEIDTIFDTPGVRPVKMSLDIQKAKKEKHRLEGLFAEGNVDDTAAVR